jgi:hypothetical protein
MKEPSPVELVRKELTVFSASHYHGDQYSQNHSKVIPATLEKLNSEKHSLSFNALKRLKISSAETIEGG